MKKWLLPCCALIMLLFLFGCSSSQGDMPKEKYNMDGSMALGATDDESLDKTKVTYSVVVYGAKGDIENIDTHEPLINMDHLDLMLENGPHHAEMKGTETGKPYWDISGSFVFDTVGKSKEEIDAMELFQGIKLVDKNNEEYILKFQYKATK